MSRKRGTTNQRRNRRVHRRDQNICQFCGAALSTKNRTVDHVVPLSRGGAKTDDNLVSSCAPCNSRKSNRTPEEAGMRLIFLDLDGPGM